MPQTLSDQLQLLRKGSLGLDQIAAFVNAAGRATYQDAFDDIERLLDHEDFIVRHNACSALVFEWAHTTRTGRILQMAASDPDEDCRSVAAAGLGTLFRGSRDRSVVELLAAIAGNSAEVGFVRVSAFLATLNVMGVPRSEQPDMRNVAIGDAHLALVERYREVAASES